MPEVNCRAVQRRSSTTADASGTFYMQTTDSVCYLRTLQRLTKNQVFFSLAIDCCYVYPFLSTSFCAISNPFFEPTFTMTTLKKGKHLINWLIKLARQYLVPCWHKVFQLGGNPTPGPVTRSNTSNNENNYWRWFTFIGLHICVSESFVEHQFNLEAPLRRLVLVVVVVVFVNYTLTIYVGIERGKS